MPGQEVTVFLVTNSLETTTLNVSVPSQPYMKGPEEIAPLITEKLMPKTNPNQLKRFTQKRRNNESKKGKKDFALRQNNTEESDSDGEINNREEKFRRETVRPFSKKHKSKMKIRPLLQFCHEFHFKTFFSSPLHSNVVPLVIREVPEAPIAAAEKNCLRQR